MIPYLTLDEIRKLVINNRKLLLANNMVYDITDYYDKHPGGQCILKKVIHLDSKSNRIIFNDVNVDLNFHSKNAKTIWKNLIIGSTKQFSFCEKLFMKLFF